MDIINDNEAKLYKHFLTSSLGSAMVMSIYTMADAVAIGKGVGPLGLSALNITTPLLCVLISSSLLFGIGGASLMSIQYGQGQTEKGNRIFTSSCIGILIFTAIYWVIYGVFMDRLISLLGGTPAIYDYVYSYMKWVLRFLPVLLLANFMSCFVRNDNNPRLSMAAVIGGGVLNVFLDWLFVFPLKMGMGGAALASMLGMLLSLLIASSHFLRKSCRLKFIKPKSFIADFKNILMTGISSFINEFSNGLIVCLFNLQILRYSNEITLSVYGVISNCSILFCSMFTGIGQAVQPLISVSYGAGKPERIKKFKRYGITTALIMGAVFTLIGVVSPIGVMKVFTTVSEETAAIGNTALRMYFIAFIFMGINIISSYYMQAVIRNTEAFIISFLRSILFSCTLVFIMPKLFGISGIWTVMPVSEALTAVISLILMKRKK